MNTRSDDRSRALVTCPFCTLLCDDLSPGEIDDPERLSCSLAQERFQTVRAETAAEARVHGRAVDRQTAIDAAVSLLRGARHPLFAGSSGDVAAVRAVLDLAEAAGGIVDHLHAASMIRNLRTFQSNGWMSTNFGELKQRADLVVMLDTDVLARHPRLVERFIAPATSVHADHKRPPDVITFGAEPVSFPDGISVQHVEVAPQRLGDLLGVLRCLLHERPLDAAQIGHGTVETLRAVLQRLLGARYGVLLWSAQSFDFEHADLTVHAAVELVAELNRHTRFACLPLIAGDGAATLQQVAGWKCGFPVRVGFGCGGPVYDPYHHDPQRLLAAGEVDALLWLSSFHAAEPPPETDLPTIVLGRSEDAAADNATVFIPVGLPGVDHDAYLFRGDGSTVIPARAVRDIGLDSAAAVLRAIHHGYSHTDEAAS